MRTENAAARNREKYLKKFNHPGLNAFFQYFLYFVGRYLLRLAYRVKVEGLNNLPASGPLLVLSKHQRFSDTPLGFSFVNMHKRRDIWCVVKRRMVEGFGAGFWPRVGAIPITRNDPEKYKQELLFAREVVKDGNSLNLFPEQTRFPYKMGLGKSTGFSIITENLENPIQVIVVAFEYKLHSFLRRTEVKISVGPVTNFTQNDDPKLFMHNRMIEMAKLCNLEYNFNLLKN